MFRKVPTLGPDVIDISATASPPWDRFGWWYGHQQIPVPTVAGMYSATVGGIMEALMLVGPVDRPGRINFGYLAGGQRYREIPEGHHRKGWLVRGVPMRVGEARRALLIPAYTWVLNNRLSDPLRLLWDRHRGGDVLLYDGLRNTNIDDPKPLSYAELVVHHCQERQHR